MRIITALFLVLIFVMPAAAEAPADYALDASKAAVEWAREHGIALESDGTLQLHEFLGMAEAVNKEIYRLQQMCPESVRNITIILSREGSIAYWPLAQRKIRIGSDFLEPWVADTWQLFYHKFGYRSAVGEIDGRTSTASLLRHELGHIFIQGIGLFNEFEQTKDKEWVTRNISVRATTNRLELTAEAFALIIMPGYRKGTLPGQMENKILRFTGCTL